MNLFKDLLFLHGHFARVEDVEPAATEAAPPAPSADVLARLQLPGGRPMHAGHRFDGEPPLEPRAGGAQQQPASCA